MLKLTLLLTVSLLFTACSTRYKTAKTSHSTHQSTKTANSKKSNFETRVLEILYQQYYSWKNVPYLYGGTTKRGVDCSAFIQNTYLVQFNLKVPRTTKLLKKEGYSISKRRLKAGDMVFFKTGRNSRHVGIYLENSKFMHASSNKGVMISSLKERYWRDHYTTSRRVLY